MATTDEHHAAEIAAAAKQIKSGQRRWARDPLSVHDTLTPVAGRRRAGAPAEVTEVLEGAEGGVRLLEVAARTQLPLGVVKAVVQDLVMDAAVHVEAGRPLMVAGSSSSAERAFLSAAGAGDSLTRVELTLAGHRSEARTLTVETGHCPVGARRWAVTGSPSPWTDAPLWADLLRGVAGAVLLADPAHPQSMGAAIGSCAQAGVPYVVADPGARRGAAPRRARDLGVPEGSVLVPGRLERGGAQRVLRRLAAGLPEHRGCAGARI